MKVHFEGGPMTGQRMKTDGFIHPSGLFRSRVNVVLDHGRRDNLAPVHAVYEFRSAWPRNGLAIYRFVRMEFPPSVTPPRTTP